MVSPIRPLPPPPPVNQGVDSRQFRDWFYAVFSNTNGNLNGLGTMAFENATDVNITGGNIANTKLSNIKTPGLTGVLYGNNTSAISAITGLSVTITTAKLTLTGTNGSMTFTNGILTSQTQAT